MKQHLWHFSLQEDAQEEFGWKLVHGDVFRPPKKAMLLSVLLGSGTQITTMTFVTLGKNAHKKNNHVIILQGMQSCCDLSVIGTETLCIVVHSLYESVFFFPHVPLFSCVSVFACLGFLSPANRGSLLTCSLVWEICILFVAWTVAVHSLTVQECVAQSIHIINSIQSNLDYLDFSIIRTFPLVPILFFTFSIQAHNYPDHFV